MICTYCDKIFSTVGSLNKHIERIHGVKSVKGTMRCLNCENKFTRRLKLVEHLKIDHGQDYEIDKLEFKTSEEFEIWRAEEERRSVAMFRNVIVNRASKNGSTTILVCSRDGRVRSNVSKKRQRALKSQGSRRIGHTCTSHMVVNKVLHPENKVIVTYVKTHYGHGPDIQHVNLSRTDKEGIAKKLALGISESRILSEAHTLNSEVGSRLEVLNKKDISNIRSQYGIGISGGRRHQNEMMSVDLWVAEEKEKQNCVVKYYKKYGDEDPEFGFQSDDFCLVIITEDQENFLKQYGQTIICVDSSHGLGGSDRTIQLSTALIVDEYGEGIPIAYMYCNKTDRSAYEKMFHCMKEAYGSKINNDYFMSDMAEAIYNAWQVVMGNSKNRLFCSWHVLQAWNRNISKVKGTTEEERKENASRLRARLRSLLFEPDQNTFERKFKEFEEGLKSPHLKDFKEYWEERYDKNAATWAYCFRQNSPVTNNMHLESMHKVIKYFHFEGRVVRRLDESISGILTYLERCLINKKRLHLKLRPWKKAKGIMEAHKKSFENIRIVESTAEDEFLVENVKSRQIYLIIRHGEVCCNPIKQCFDCNVCRHSFTCSCPNFFLDASSICKHVHFVARETSKKQPQLANTNTNKNMGLVEETKEACGNNLLSRPTLLASNLKKDFIKFVKELSSYEDTFDKIPLANQKEIVRFLRTSTILCKEEETLKENKTGSKMNGCKRKISKQEEFCNKVKEIQGMKKKKKKMMVSSKPSSRAFASELKINEFAPWVDGPVDHEEVV
ncbi:uncharacterized protein LOC128987253 [Macrosteles quadrilineatus]|uniref:uncharacterized protein LOC128987253 n=1 Tax=Macrosteles quadrilineatus TaxID=74068 RepID=UPI0023E209F0|nr:uncharacterized protein LOC128987253 [Macrosteles quadrilineatus]